MQCDDVDHQHLDVPHVQVQDKALDVLANHIRGDPAACRMHLAMIQQATRHHALSVRKRAVDIIWSCYISDEVFSATNRALCNKLLLIQLQMFEGVPSQITSTEYLP